jgi:hypothetical protein
MSIPCQARSSDQNLEKQDETQDLNIKDGRSVACEGANPPQQAQKRNDTTFTLSRTAAFSGCQTLETG